MKATTLTVCGKPYTGIIHRSSYIQGDAPALVFVDPKGLRIATLTVNLVGEVLLPDYTYIKDYSENTGVLEQLVSQGIVRDTGTRTASGFVTLPLVEIIEPALKGDKQ